MRRIIGTSYLAAIGFLIVTIGGTPASAEAFNDAQKAEIERIVGEFIAKNPEFIAEYLRQNPEILLEVSDILRAKQAAQEQEAKSYALDAHREQIERHLANLFNRSIDELTLPDLERALAPYVDANGKPMAEGMGKTVDISQGGALLETGRPIESEFILMLSIDLEKKVVETKGRVAHSRPNGSSTYLTGIKFEGTPDEVTNVIRNLVIDYHRRRLGQ